MERGSLGQHRRQNMYGEYVLLPFARSPFSQMANLNNVQTSLNMSPGSKLNTEQEKVFFKNDELRSRNREEIIEKLERVIQEKNASILRLQDREQHLEDAFRKRNIEFKLLEDRLQQFEEKTQKFEQLHQLQVQTFEKTIRDCQIENDRLSEHISDLNRALTEKGSLDELNREKILTFDRIVADTQLWRKKLDSYKETIELHEQTIANLKRDISDLHRKRQTNGDFEDSSLRLQIINLQNGLEDRDHQIADLKQTLRHVHDTLQPDHLSHQSRWKSCDQDMGTRGSTFRKNRSISPPIVHSSSPLDIDFLTKKLHSLTDRLTHVQQLLVKRDEQILTLKKVHDKRWLRLKHLQKQYNSLKNELQSYTDDEAFRKASDEDFFYRKAIRKTRNGCSVCNDHRWRKQSGITRKLLKQEDDDHVWNEVTKLRRDSGRLTNENLSLHEKIDLQEVEIHEQRLVIDELRHEIRRLNDQRNESVQSPPIVVQQKDDQKQLIEELDRKLYQIESERTNLIFEHERLKTNYDLCINDKQHLTDQRTQINSELKKSKLRILALQDQLHKFKRNQVNLTSRHDQNPPLTTRRGIIKKKAKKFPRTKSCLEMLLDQNTTIIDDLHNQSIISNKPRQHSCSICDHHNDPAAITQKRRSSISSTVSKTRYGSWKRTTLPRSRLTTSSMWTSRSSSTLKAHPTRISTLQKCIEQLRDDLVHSREENEHLNRRLSTTLSRINMLKTTNQKLIDDREKFKTNQDSISIDNSINVDNLYERLKNTSTDAAQQRKLNKTLQENNESLKKNIQSLTEKLIHSERDIASKRLLIDNYKTRLNEMEINRTPTNDKNTHENDDERMKFLTDTMEKLRISIESYKNRLQAITREKHELDSRYTQLLDEHQQMKIRHEDMQTKFRSTEQQFRQNRLDQDRLNEELTSSRRSFDQQLSILNNKSQDSLKKITTELDRTLQRLNEYERFIHGLFHEMIGRSHRLTDNLKRAREYQKQRESLSITLPGFDTAMTTASRILNLTQDDLDEIMSVTDESFQGNTTDKNEKIRQKVSKLLLSKEECAGKLLKLFSKKLDELQLANQELSLMKNT